MDSKFLKLVPNLDKPEELVIVNSKYNFCYNHESPKHANLHIKENWPNGENHFIENDFFEFKKRYSLRIENFRNYINDTNNKILFGITKKDPQNNCYIGESLKELHEIIKLKYPHLNYEIILIQ